MQLTLAKRRSFRAYLLYSEQNVLKVAAVEAATKLATVNIDEKLLANTTCKINIVLGQQNNHHQLGSRAPRQTPCLL